MGVGVNSGGQMGGKGTGTGEGEGEGDGGVVGYGWYDFEDEQIVTAHH